MRIRARKDQADQDARTVERVREAMDGYLDSHGPDVSVSVRHVRDLLNPRGMWSHDPERRTAERPAAGTQPTPADGDPLTGCRPVTPP